MMLHTDAFNRNAKTKMTKLDYIRNTASSEVAPEVLEVRGAAARCARR